jgi:hypothetical protein
MTSLETLYTKNVTSELSFLLVTHTTYFDIRFGRYGILNQVQFLADSGQSGTQVFDQGFRPQNG